MKTVDRVVVDPELKLGQPCSRGSRLPVYVVVEAIAAGTTPDDLIDENPYLTREDIGATWTYAARLAEIGLEVA